MTRASASQSAIVAALLDEHGMTFTAEAGIKLADTPSPLFETLCLALLSSARISASVAVAAERSLRQAGWTTAQRMSDSTWERRAKVLNESGYARYDERTATMLGSTAELLLDRYRGDLRRMRDEAEHDPAAERELLKECKGIGDVGVDIFFREVQGIWQEVAPFFGRRELDTASRLGLPHSTDRLAETCKRDDVPRLAAALVRVASAGSKEMERLKESAKS